MYRKWHLLEKAELNIYFPNYFPAKLPDKLHYPQDYPKLLKQRKILFSSVWYKAWLVLVIVFSKMRFGKKWLWRLHKISHKKCNWRLLENTILAHYLKGKIEVLNNHKPLSGGLKQFHCNKQSENMFGKCVASLNSLEIGVVKQSMGLEYIISLLWKGIPMLLWNLIIFIYSC